jgi:hypothetical protein
MPININSFLLSEEFNDHFSFSYSQSLLTMIELASPGESREKRGGNSAKRL